MLDKLTSEEAVLKELGKRLRQRRVRARLKQQELADRVGLSRSTVSRIENGHAVQTPEWIRYLRGVGLLGDLEQILPDLAESPLARARVQKKRAGVPKRVYQSGQKPPGLANAAPKAAASARQTSRRGVGDVSSTQAATKGYIWPEDRD
ncbi:MAG: helix-turn-helix transcriptional regulator [Alcanivoracaceae bacterium]